MPIETHPSFAVVMDDVVGGLRPGFTPRGTPEESFTVPERFGGEEVITNEVIVAVPWTYVCVHSGDFLGLFPTGRELTIQGMTFFDSRAGDPMLHRYVDWAGVIAQLHLEVSWRIPVNEDEYAFGRAQA